MISSPLKRESHPVFLFFHALLFEVDRGKWTEDGKLGIESLGVVTYDMIYVLPLWVSYCRLQVENSDLISSYNFHRRDGSSLTIVSSMIILSCSLLIAC